MQTLTINGKYYALYDGVSDKNTIIGPGDILIPRAIESGLSGITLIANCVEWEELAGPEKYDEPHTKRPYVVAHVDGYGRGNTTIGQYARTHGASWMLRKLVVSKDGTLVYGSGENTAKAKSLVAMLPRNRFFAKPLPLP